MEDALDANQERSGRFGPGLPPGARDQLVDLGIGIAAVVLAVVDGLGVKGVFEIERGIDAPGADERIYLVTLVTIP